MTNSLNLSLSDALLDNSSLTNLEKEIKATFRKLTKFSESSKFQDKTTQAFGSNFDGGELEILRQDWAKGDFSNLPKIEIRSATELHGAKGAFSSETNTIYLSREFILSNTKKSKQISAVLLEEIGHWTDSKINKVDAAGDEGEIFSTLAQGKSLSQVELSQLKSENDSLTINIDGKSLTVEAVGEAQEIDEKSLIVEVEAVGEAQDNLGLLSDKVDDLLNAVKGKIPVGSLDNIPLLGSLNTNNYVNQLFDGVLNQVKIIETTSVLKVRESLFNALGSSGLNVLADLDGDGDVDLEDVQAPDTADAIAFQFKLGKSFNESIAVAESFGLPTLGFDLNGNASIKVDVGLTVGFGVDKDGIFLNTGDSGEFQITLDGKLVDAANNPLTAQGKLGVLNLQGVDNGSLVHSDFTADLTSASADVNGRVKLTDLGSLSVAPDPTLTANAELKLKLNTGFDSEANDILPSIEADFNLLNWQYDSSNPATPAPSVSLDNVTLDVGNFAGEILSPIKDILEPINEVLDPFITPLPIIDKSFLDLVENIPDNISPSTYDFVRDVETIAGLTGGGSYKIDLGSFNLTGGDIRTTDLSSTTATPTPAPLLAAGISSAEPDFIKNLRDIGFNFPILDNPENGINLLLGKPDVNLFTYETPKFSFRYDVPDITIPVFGPIVIKIGGHAEAGAQVTFGYDSSGLASGNLEDGFYVVRPDADPRNVDSRKGSNVYGEAEIDASAGVSVGIVSLTVGGGINLGLGLNFAEKLAQEFTLPDSTTESRVRGSDLTNPFCAFDVGGGLSVIIFGQMEIDLGFFSVTERLDLADIKLIDFSEEPNCVSDDSFNVEDPEPTEDQQKSLDKAGIIDRKGTDIGNDIIVDHKGGTWKPTKPGSTEQIEVGGTGIDPDPQTYDEVTLVVINGAGGNDTIQFINGVEAPGQVKGGDGDDNILTGKGNDFIIGGQGNDTIDGGVDDHKKNTADYGNSPNGINVNLSAGVASNDGFGNQDTLANIQNVQGSAKNDVIIGNNQENYLNGGDGNDDLEGGDGDDVLLGGKGADIIRGGGHIDTTTYLDSSSAVSVNLSGRAFFGDITLPDGVSPLFLAAYSGQGGSANGDQISEVENVSGSAYDDILVASNGNGIIDGFLGNDIIYAGPIGDTLIGGEGFAITDQNNGTISYTPGSDWLSYKLADDGVGVNVSFVRGDGIGGYAAGDELQKIVPKEGGGFENVKGSSFENLEGSTYSDTLEGDGDKNIIRGLSGDDEIKAQGNDDLLIGGAGADFLDGGDGKDTASYLDSPDKVTVDLQFNNGALADAQGDTFSGIEDLIGSNFGDTLYGNAGSNGINPSLSNGQLDFVDGEAEIDTLFVDYSIDDYGLGIYGGFNGLTTGNIKHYDTDGVALLDEVTFEDIESIVVTGTIRDDSIVGGSGDDIIWLSEGNDFIDGGGGIDWLDGNRGIDTLSDDLSNKGFGITLQSFNITQENLSQSLSLSDGTKITGFEIFKDIKTGSGNDILTQKDRVNNNFSTGAGADVVDPGLGFDTVDGGVGNFQFNDTNDTLVLNYSVGDTGSGMVMFAGFAYRSINPNDPEDIVLDAIEISNFEQYQVTGTSKGDFIVLGDGNDSIDANAGDDFLRGNGGNDSINAGDGNDVIIGTNQTSADIDTLTGGAGADLFVLGDALIAGSGLNPHFYEKADGNDYALITDFNPSQGDKIQLPNCGAIGSSSGHGYTLEDFSFFGFSALYSEEGNELIAILQGSHGLDINNTSYFQYVGAPCPEPPS